MIQLTSKTEPGPSSRRPRAEGWRWTFAAFALGCLAFAPSPLSATASLIVQIEGQVAASRWSVDLTDPAGGAETFSDDDSDGILVIEPAGGAGEYRLTLRRGARSEERAVNVPESGLVTVTYRAGAAGEKWVVAYSGYDFGNDEIVVTARKREENLQTTPISITAFTAPALRARSMRNLRNVGDFTPNLHFSVSGGIDGAPSVASVFIRGIGHLGSGIFEDPAVGIYVDGVYLARAQGSVFDLLDLERVEVLRGPQGTLFGKNTIGGAVSLVTRKPSNQFAGDVELTVGDLDRLDVRARVGGGLSEKVYGSFAAQTARRDGYARSLATGREYNNDDRWVARGALRFLPSDRTVIDLTADFTDEDIDGLDQVLVSLGDDDPANFVVFYNQVMASAGLPTYSEAFVSSDLYESFSGSPNRHAGDVAGLTLRFDSVFGPGNLTSITAVRRLDFDDTSDRDGIPQVFVDVAARQQQEQLSQELRWNGLGWDDRLTWTLGGLYFEEDAESDGVTDIFDGLFEALEAAPGPVFSLPGLPNLCDPGPAPPGFPCLGGAGNPLNFIFGTGFVDATEQEVRSYAAFGQATWAASARLSATAGLRYTLEEKDFSFDRINLPLNVRTALANDDRWNALSPKLGLEFQLTPEHLLYGSVSWGFKSGGFNGITQGRAVLDPFDPEEIVAYEAGFKTDWLDNRLRVNGALFFNDYTDIQFTSALIDDSGVISFPIRNAGEAETRGFELDLALRPTRRFELTGAVGYLDTEYTELDSPGPGGPRLDGEFPKAPDWTVSLSPQIRFEAGDAGTISLRVDYSYRGRVFHDVFNAETSAQPAYSLINSRLTFVDAADRWEIALFGTNLGDEQYIENGLFVVGFGPTLVVAGRPREWGLSARYRF